MDEISFSSGRDRCAAWRFDASGDAFAGVRGVPCVVTAPGLINTAITRTSVMRGADAEQRAARVARLYERRGYTAERAAANILRAAGRNRAVAPIAPEAHFMYAVTRVAPPVARWFAARTSDVLAK